MDMDRETNATLIRMPLRTLKQAKTSKLAQVCPEDVNARIAWCNQSKSTLEQHTQN